MKGTISTLVIDQERIIVLTMARQKVNKYWRMIKLAGQYDLILTMGDENW